MHMKLHGWKTVSGFLFTVAIAAVGGGSAGSELGCSATASGDASSSGSSGGEVIITPPTGCAQDSSVDCSGIGDGFSCMTGDNPEAEDPTLSCSTPTSSAGEDDYCCFTFSGGGSTTCVADDDLTAVCPDPDSYGYQCDSGDDPTSLDSSLNCSQSTPDADGVHDDFCCTLGGSSSTSSSGSSSGGVVPANCTADSTIDCSGGGDGFSCDSGDNPEVEDPTLSCSTSTPDADGVHDDFCCITFDGSSTSCVADDTLDCTAGDAYGYQCDSGDDPTSLDASLTCSASTPDPDGVHDDFCCNP
jgi:hypothetical protein